MNQSLSLLFLIVTKYMLWTIAVLLRILEHCESNHILVFKIVNTHQDLSLQLCLIFVSSLHQIKLFSK